MSVWLRRVNGWLTVPCTPLRIVAICRQVPTIVVLFLDRPAIVPEIAEASAALLVEFGARDDAVGDVLLITADAQGGCRSTYIIDESRRGESKRRPIRHRDPLFRFGDGIVGSQVDMSQTSAT
jgi:beta-glucosidase